MVYPGGGRGLSSGDRFNLVNHNQHGVDTAKYGQKELSSS